jgi:hypothetical protein
MTDDTPDPDLQRIVEEMAPDPDDMISIDDPSPALSELVGLALGFGEHDMERLLTLARNIARQRRHT